MTIHPTLRDTIRHLCKHALEGELKLHDFNKMWPTDANAIPFLKQIFEDVEDGIEHVPGYFFKRGVDYTSWRASDAYFTILLDLTLLDYDVSAQVLFDCRNEIFKQSLRSGDAIIKSVKACLTSGKETKADK